MTKWCALACVMAFAAAAAAAEVIEVPLTYVEFEDEQNWESVHFGSRDIMILDEPKRSMQLPDLPDQLIRYGVFNLGESEFQMAVARAEQDGEYAYSIFLEADGVVSSLDTESRRYRKHTDQTHAISKRQQVEYMIGDKKLPMATEFHFRDILPGSENEFSIFSLSLCAGYKGRFELNGSEHQVVLCNRTGRGLFEHKPVEVHVHGGVAYPTGGDIITVAPADEQPDYYNYVVITDYVCLQGNVYALDVDVPNGKLTLSPFSGPTARIDIPDEVKSLLLLDPANGKSVSFFSPGEAVKAPAGEYQLLAYTLNRTEPEGDVWRLVAHGGATAPLLKAAADDSVKLEFGEPYTIALANTDLQRRNDVYSLQMTLTGRAEDHILILERISGDNTKIPMANEKMPKEPTYRIANADGEVLAAGNFEYG